MPEAAAKPEKSAEAPKAKSAGGGGKMVPALLGLNTLLLAAVLGMALLRPAGLGHAAAKSEHAGETVAAKEGHGAGAKGEKGEGKGEGGAHALGPMLKLPDFVVHLRDVETEHYARITFELELPDEKAKEEVTARIPLIRDAFLVYLSDRTSDELRGGEAIVRVKAALTARMGEALPGLPVKNLFVTEMVVQ